MGVDFKKACTAMQTNTDVSSFHDTLIKLLRNLVIMQLPIILLFSCTVVRYNMHILFCVHWQVLTSRPICSVIHCWCLDGEEI